MSKNFAFHKKMFEIVSWINQVLTSADINMTAEFCSFCGPSVYESLSSVLRDDSLSGYH